MTRAIASLSAFALLAVGACAQMPAVGSVGVGQAVEKTVYVAAETRPCSTGVARVECLQVRESVDQPWTLHYFGYEGFEHKPGVEYRLRVRGTPVANPPADASSVRWSLIEILDQKPARP
ncbi:DUF4377 domain-containing protein [Brevundimonas faecalis]|uniref:DUF4377 domain-containing protein n=1 Tax=Brevundimonas faecalis TaxID=947378 RepID=A0ABV2RFC8_9CAUL